MIYLYKSRKPDTRNSRRLRKEILTSAWLVGHRQFTRVSREFVHRLDAELEALVFDLVAERAPQCTGKTLR